METVQKKGNILLVDIGSGSVGCAIARLEGQGKAKVISSIRKEIPFQAESSFNDLSYALLQTLESVIKEMRENEKVQVEHIHCFLSSPWHVSEMRKVSLASKKQFVISHKEVDTLIRKEVDIFTKEAGERYERFAKETPDLIEVKNIQIKLNGYQTNDPYGKKATSFETKLFVSLSKKNLVDSIRNRIGVYFANEIDFHTFTLASFSCIRNIFSNKTNFLFVDITGETTNVLYSQNGVISDIISVPVGRKTLIRRIASKFMTSPYEAFSQFVLFSQGKLDTTSAGRIQKTLDRFGGEWSNDVLRAVQKITLDMVPPHTLFTTAGPSVSDWFGQVLSEKYMDAFAFNEDTLTIYALRGNIFDKFVTHKVDVPRDPFLMLETLFISKIL